MLCKCDQSSMFPRCNKNPDYCIKLEKIVDTSNPNVVHIIYPNGRDVPEEMLDPNIGGFLGRKK
jgi:hypothetical protein